MSYIITSDIDRNCLQNNLVHGISQESQESPVDDPVPTWVASLPPFPSPTFLDLFTTIYSLGE